MFFKLPDKLGHIMPILNDLIVDKDSELFNLLSRNEYGTFFGVSQEVLDRVWSNLTSPAGNSVVYASMEIGADLDVFHPVKDRLNSLQIKHSTDAVINSLIKRTLNGPEKIPNYGGGLGVLAGDTLKSFAACKIPVIAISLMYRKGYFSQLVDSRLGQVAWSTEWEPEMTPGLYLLKNPQYPERPLEIEVPFFDENNRSVLAKAQLWLKMELNENLDYFVPELLLDYSVTSSPDWIRKAAYHLYDSSSEKIKAVQRRMLGAGIIQVMQILGISSRTLHINEQHAAIALLHLIADQLLEKLGADFQALATDSDIIAAAEDVAARIVYTIHTPVKAGHDRFGKTVYAELGHVFCRRILDLLAQDQENPDAYNLTVLTMRVNRATNSVSRLHRQVTARMFPQHADKIKAITNGVHHLTWISKAKAEVFDSFPELDNWRQDPGVFANAAQLLDNNKFRSYLDRAWANDHRILINYVNEMQIDHRKQALETWIDPPNFLSHLDEFEGSLDPSVFTIGFARRFSTYKRPDLIFDDIDKLAEIIRSMNLAVNFLFAGKAHPADEPGKSVIKLILDLQEELYLKSKGLAKLVFIPGYDMKIAKMMVAGVHAWLNNPKRPLEASGTSGMKAAMNAVPNISIMDGWWGEGYHAGRTGWKFGAENSIEAECMKEDLGSLLYAEDSASFYKLFPEILNEFYDPALKQRYLDKCIMNIALNTPRFNSHRLAAEYAAEYGLRLSPQVEKNLNRLRKLYRSDRDAR